MTAGDVLRVEVDTVAATVRLTGQLTFTTVAEFDAALRGLPGPHLVLDVAALTFCDSAGLAAFIGASLRAERSGGDVTLVGASPALRRVLQLTGMEPLFVIGTGVPDAAGPAAQERSEPA